MICLCLAVVTLLIYQPLFHAQFTGYDDPDYVTANPHVLGGLTLQNLRWALFTGHADNWHPVTWVSHMIDSQIFGRNPGARHGVNIVFHIANTLLLFLWLFRVTAARWRSALVAALFALHPLHVQSVAWISERKDVLSTLFWMLTLFSYTLYAKKARARYYYISLLLFATGIMAKPMLVTLPCVLLLLDYWPLKRFGDERPSRLILEKIPFLMLSAVSSVITLVVQGKQAMVSTTVVPLGLRIANAVFAYAAYIGKMICPARLAVIYPYNLHPSFAQIGATALSLVLISVYVLVLARRWPYLATGWLWFIGTLVPVIGIIQVGAQAMADRYTYVPMTGLFIIVAWGANDVFNACKVPGTARGLCAAGVIAACALATRMQLPYWHDSIALFEHAIENTPGNDIAQINLGVALANQQRHEEAIGHYSTALELQPRSPRGWNDLGLSLAATGRIGDAIIAYKKALKFDPSYGSAHNNLAIALGQMGRLEEAALHYRVALRFDPDNAAAQGNLAIILGEAGHFDEAAHHFTEAFRLDPESVNTHYNFGNLLMNNAMPAEALAQYSEALRLRPGFADAHCNMAIVLLGLGRVPEAIRHYEAALQSSHENLQAMEGLAWVYATNPDASVRNTTEAIRLAERACKISTNREPGALDTLAAAYANAGRFEDALRIANQALALAESSGQKEQALYLRKRIQLYGANQPYRVAVPLKKQEPVTP